ncbi:ATP-binding protein [Paenibacillus sp. FSL R7-0313]|uniref:ATP-binding protein n=1 Tax=Paenibacillus sp. FSL R7-0313 TaxID=2954532 RepID=UPI0030DA0F30
MNIDVSDINRPYVPPKTHPIETGIYFIGTKEVRRMYKNIKQWIENRAPGGIAYGRPRLGKTWAIDYLTKELPIDFGEKLPILKFKCEQNSRINETTFYEELLVQFGHGIPFSGRKTMKAERLKKYLQEIVESSGSKRLILFIDDAQRLVPVQYNILMDIYNYLKEFGISMTVILVGQEELKHVRSGFIASKMGQIVGRFMVHEYKFSGVRTKDELQTCLVGYDSLSEYPTNSGWSYTRFFFPDAYEQGFRLESSTEELFSTISNIRKEKGITKPLEVPMQYLTLTIEYAFKKYGVLGKNVDHLTSSHWLDSLGKSGYIENELYNDLI